MRTYTIDDARNLLSQCHEARVAQAEAERERDAAMARAEVAQTYRSTIYAHRVFDAVRVKIAHAEVDAWTYAASDATSHAEDCATHALRALLVATGDVDDDEESWRTAQDYLDEFGNGADAQTYVEARLRAIDAATRAA